MAKWDPGLRRFVDDNVSSGTAEGKAQIGFTENQNALAGMPGGRTSSWTDAQGNVQRDPTGETGFTLAPGYLDDNSNVSRSYSFLGGTNADVMAKAEQLRGLGAAVAARKAPQANLQADNAARGQQMALANLYRAQAAGNGPSVAGFQAQRGIDAAAGRGNMAAATASPNNVAGAQRLAMLGAGAQSGATAQAAAGTRAGETLGANSGLGGLGGAMRGADMSAAQRQSALGMQNRQFGDKMVGAYEDQALDLENLQMHGQQGRLGGFLNARDMAQQEYLDDLKRQAKEREAAGNLAVTTGMTLAKVAGMGI